MDHSRNLLAGCAARSVLVAFVAVGTGLSCEADPSSSPPDIATVIAPVVLEGVEKIRPDDAGSNHDFGRAVAFDGTTVLVGAPSYDNIGRVFVFRDDGSGFVQEAMLVPTTSSGVRDFGAAVTVQGDIAVVGAPDLDGNSEGDAFVFRRDAGGIWTEEAHVGPYLPDGSMFGRSLALDGEWLVVGAPHTEASGAADGLAFVYQRSGGGWVERAQLQGNGAPLFHDRFGQGVAIEGDLIAVGAPGGSLATTGVRIYLYERSGAIWNESATIESGGAFDCALGWDIDIAGSWLAAGCPVLQLQIGGTPAVHVYTQQGSSWQLDQELFYGGSTRTFGRVVSLDGNTLWVGAYLADVQGADSGCVSVFSHDGITWGLEGAYLANDTASEDELGASVAAYGDRGIVGVPRDDDDGNDSGSAWVVVLKKELGAACTEDESCASGFCVDGVCCDDVCGGGDPVDCQACSAATGASQDGECKALTGTDCEDGDPCTETGTCGNGVCQAGDPVQCTPGDACHVAGTCDSSTGECSNPAAPDGTPCPGGTCENGVCVLPDGGTAGGGGSAGSSGSGGSSGTSGGGGVAGTSGGSGQAGAGGGGSGGVSGSGGTGATGGGGGAGDAGPGAVPGDGVGTSGFYACSYGRRRSGADAASWLLVLLGSCVAWRRRTKPG